MITNPRAAAERITNAPRYWTGSIPVGPGSVDIDIEDAVRVAAAYLERERCFGELRGYLKHKGSCPASPKSSLKMEAGPCDCGLDSIIEKLEAHQ